MKKFLKILVIVLGLLIIALFGITIFTISSKYKNNEFNAQQSIKLIPPVEKKYKILSFHVEKKTLYVYVKNPLTEESKIKIYDLSNGNLITNIDLN